MLRQSFILFFVFGILSALNGQNTFQKIYNTGTDLSTQAYKSEILSDGSIIMAGITEYSSSDRFFLSKTNCQGEIDWFHVYEGSSSINNTSPTILPLKDKGLFVTYNVGVYQAYNIVTMVLDSTGQIVWKNLMPGARNDKVNGAVQTADEGYLLVGTTNSYGQDIVGSLSYRDAYVIRLDKDGNELWSRTFGNAQAIDEAWDVVVTQNGAYAITGRYIHNEAFYILLLVIDDEGLIQHATVYGGINHRNYGFGIINAPDGDVIITGMTTLNKDDHTSDPDAFLIKAKPSGEIAWSYSYAGSANDNSDIGSSVVALEDGGYAMAVATMSYPTSGFVPNKHVVIKTTSQGFLSNVVSFVNGSAHYPSVHRSPGQSGLLVAGFSNAGSLDFKPHLTRTNDNLISGCNDTEQTGLTIIEVVTFEVAEPIINIGIGSQWIPAASSETLTSFEEIITLCENIVDPGCEEPLTSTTDLNTSFSIGTLSPNPAIDQVQIELTLKESEQIKIELYTQTGILLTSNTTHLPAGQQWHTIPLDQLSNGLYVLRIGLDDSVVSRKVLVMGK